MLASILSRIIGRGRASSSSTLRRRRRSSQRIAAASGQAIQALEGRVLLSVLYVDVNAPGPTHTGASWASAYKDLQLALSASTPGTEIRVADGTYKPTSGTNRAISFNLRNGVAIRGGYAGHGTVNPDARDIALYRTILSGDIGTPGSSADNSYSVVTAKNVGASTVLDGVTVTGGNANPAGGGLFVSSASPTILNCTFSGNVATGGGGMANVASSSPTLINCVFTGNVATTGTAVRNDSSSPVMINCTITGNMAFNAGDENSGGGVYSYSSSPKSINCIIWGNAGGGIVTFGGTHDITYSIVERGHAGAGNINADPLFVRSPWTGPDGQFGTTDDDPGDLRLRPGSPALNVGSNAAIPAGVSTDIAGNARVQGGTVDLGAYEGSTATPAPKTLYVDIAASGGVNDGTSWAHAFTSLASALAVADYGSIIRIAQGTYTPTDTADRALSFALRNGVAVYGGYAGHAAADPNARDIAAYATILSGDIAVHGKKTDNSYHVVTAIGMGASTVLDGVTVTGGYGDGSGHYSYGGGLLVASAAPTLVNCAINGNWASMRGGGMHNAVGAAPTLINCMFSGNATDASSRFTDGGAVYNTSFSTATFINCTFSGNSATKGGAIYAGFSAQMKLTSCIVWGNVTTNHTQLHQSGGALLITHSIIQGGYAGAGNINADPLFVRSPWTGPDGRFGTADDDPGDLRLRPGSPALNVGSNAALPAGVSTDIAGNARIQGGTVDCGAHEGSIAPPAPQTIYVDGAARGSDAGTSWVNAFTDLQPALSAARDGDTIRMAGGTYKPTNGTSRTVSFVLRNGVAIVGGYAGQGAADPDVRDTVAYLTVLSGNIGAAAAHHDNSYHVVTAVAVGAATVLDGVTITGGNSSGDGVRQKYGGGIIAVDASPTLFNCVISGNRSDGYGAGMHNYFASPTLINCTISSNMRASSTTILGGGMHNESSTPTLIGCTLYGNDAGYGGAMFNTWSSPTLVNCTLSGNRASTHGGGMVNSQSSPTLINCSLSGNSADGASSHGGAIYSMSSSSPHLTNCIVWGNTATNGTHIHQVTGVASITYSNVQGGYSGTGNTDVDPLFIRAPWTGPDGIMNTDDDEPGDLRLRPGSPMLNAGLSAAVPASVSTDLLGSVRIQGGAVDMGAYEGPTAPPVPRILYVDASALDGANDGGSWADAFTSLAAALAAAWDGDTIRIADGTYRPTSGVDRMLSFALRSGVAIYGGYAGHGASDPDARDIIVYATVLSGDIATIGSNADNSYRVVTANGVGASARLDGVTITAGNANGTGILPSGGGGLSATSASPTLVNCTFTANFGSSGGGMHNSGASPTLANCVFVGNAASKGGGGVANAAFSSPTLVNCTFSRNSASSGGGMANYSSSPTLINCTFSGNSVTESGGGMNNSVSASSTLINCTFTGNSAVTGGGLHNSATVVNLINCTFTGNWASSNGGGIFNAYPSSTKLTNCIVWGNNGGAVVTSIGTPNIAHSSIQGGHIGTGNIDADPLFVRNPSPGPDGKWGTADDDYGDLRLRPESPCVDRGNNNATGLAGIATDLAGRPRFVDVALTPDAGLGTPPIIDMGAYEVQWRAPAWLDPAGVAAWNFDTYSVDIGQNTLTIAADDVNRPERLADVRQFIAAGRAGGAGIVSGAAGEERWVVVTLDAEGSIVVRLALIGDVTLDDRVDGDDYFALDQAYLFSGGFTLAADLNLDGRIDGGDYFVLDRAFVRVTVGGVWGSAGMAGGQAARESAGNVFSTRSIAEELLLEEALIIG